MPKPKRKPEHCENCGRPIRQRGKGRPRRFCPEKDGTAGCQWKAWSRANPRRRDPEPAGG